MVGREHGLDDSLYVFMMMESGQKLHARRYGSGLFLRLSTTLVGILSFCFVTRACDRIGECLYDGVATNMDWLLEMFYAEKRRFLLWHHASIVWRNIPTYTLCAASTVHRDVIFCT